MAEKNPETKHTDKAEAEVTSATYGDTDLQLPEDLNYRCEKCGKRFTSDTAVKYHESRKVCMKKRKRDIERVKALERKLKLKKAKMLRNNTPKKDTKAKRIRVRNPVVCTKCGNTYGDTYALNYHLKHNVCEKIIAREKKKEEEKRKKDEEKEALAELLKKQLPPGNKDQRNITLEEFNRAAAYLERIVNPLKAADIEYSASLTVPQMKQYRALDAYCKHMDLQKNNRVHASELAVIGIWGRKEGVKSCTSRSLTLRSQFEKLCENGTVDVSLKGRHKKAMVTTNDKFREDLMQTLKRMDVITMQNAGKAIEEVMAMHTGKHQTFQSRRIRRWLLHLGFHSKRMNQQWVYVQETPKKSRRKKSKPEQLEQLQSEIA